MNVLLLLFVAGVIIWLYPLAVLFVVCLVVSIGGSLWYIERLERQPVGAGFNRYDVLHPAVKFALWLCVTGTLGLAVPIALTIWLF